MNITIHRNGEYAGPYTLDQINEYLANGTLNETDLAWHEGCQDWLPVSDIITRLQTSPPNLPPIPTYLPPIPTAMTPLVDKMEVTMGHLVFSKRTSLSSEEVIMKAVLYFSTKTWRLITQNNRSATFHQENPPGPTYLIVLLLPALVCGVVPGLIILGIIRGVSSARRAQNLAIVVTQTKQGSEVVLTYPSYAKATAKRFISTLP